MDLPLQVRDFRQCLGERVLVVAFGNNVEWFSGKISQGVRAFDVSVVDQNGLSGNAGWYRVILAGMRRLPGEPGHADMGVVFFQHREDFCIVFGNANAEFYAQIFGKELCQFIVVAGRPVLSFNIDRGREAGDNVQNTLFPDFLEGGGS